MKNTRLLLLVLALTAFSVHCDSMGGLAELVIKGNPDPNSCLLHLTTQVFNNRIVFTETVTDNPPNCAYQNLTWWSLYRNDWSVSGQITLAPTNNPTVFRGTLTRALLNQYNGSACVTTGKDQVPINDRWYYYCQFKYGSIIVNVAFWFNKTGNVFDTSSTDLFYPVYGLTEQQNLSQYNDQAVIVDGPGNFTGIQAMFYTECGGWGTQVSSLSTPVTITGKIYASQIVPLHPAYQDFQVTAVIVRKVTPNNPEQYHVAQFYGWFPFADPANGGGECFITDKTWGDILPNMNYCDGGCHITLDMFNPYNLAYPEAVPFQTNGISTT